MPAGVSGAGDYEALFAYAQKRLDKCVFGERNQPVSSVRCTVTSLQSVKSETDYALGRAENAVASSDLNLRHLIDDKRPVPELPEKYRPRNKSAGEPYSPANKALTLWYNQDC